MACADWLPRVALAAACIAPLLAGCAARPVDPYFSSAPPAMLTTVGHAGVRDLRATYRAAACARLPKSGTTCDDLLIRLPGEEDAATLPAASALQDQYRIAFVPGLFSECFDRYARPFDDVQRALAEEGFLVDYFRVPGRGTSADNAKRLVRHFAALPDDPRPIIVFAYSKGLPDTLEFVVQYPKAASRIAAIVSVAGAANGSPLAHELHGVYRKWAAAFPLPGCDAGSGDEVHDLRRDVRLEWWRRNGSAVTIPVFALVAAPRPDRVSPGTRATYNQLARIDPRNDGKLLAQDQVVPGGYLLGYANADHWAIAIPLDEALPSWSLIFRDGVPRPALARAAIEVVAETLRTTPAR